MDEFDDIGKKATHELAGASHELVINVHRHQAIFLQQLAAATNLEPSTVCQQLIDLAVSSDAEWQNDSLYSPAVKSRLGAFARETGDGKWTQVRVNLDRAHFDTLCSLTGPGVSSNSKAMRHLLSGAMDRFNISTERRVGRHTVSKKRIFLSSAPYFGMASIALLAVVALTVFFLLQNGTSIEVGPHWAGSSAQLIFDPHTHTRYSDGRLSPRDLVDLAVQNGCDALVISDHSDTKGTVSDEQMLDLQELRGDYPELLLLAGIELNMPSYGGREHAGLIADPSVPAETLQQLRDEARRGGKRVKNGGASHAADQQLLQIVADYQSLQKGLLLVYNHPSRKDSDISENFSDLVKWNTKYPAFTVIEGAPGHQNAPVLGSYEEPYLTQDRWDPVVAEVGGVWDQLLSEGHQLWGAMASSDYHNEELDKAPCEFSRTHLIVPEQSYRGVLKALEMGTFWADHGRILNQLWFSVEVDGLEQVAYPGYTVYVGDRDSIGSINLSIERGPGSVGLPLTVEFIGNCISGEAEVVTVQQLAPEDSAITALVPLAATGQDGASCTLRARVRLINESSADYLAYTNPIRLVLD